jgi:hypothetical protein
MANKNWFPTTQESTLAMGQLWNKQIQTRGERDWRMTAEEVGAFNDAVITAENEMVAPKEKRSPEDNLKRREALSFLEKKMRDTKRQFFNEPLLSVVDLKNLGLKPKDTTPTTLSAPKLQANVKVVYKAAGFFELHISPAQDIGTEDKRSYYGCRIVYDLYSATDAAPTDRKVLFESKFTRKKKEEFVFQSDDSGKRVYFSVRYENSKGEAGPWNPIASALIP